MRTVTALQPPPNDLVLERALLGTAIMSPSRRGALLHLKPDDFYNGFHADVWRSVLEMAGDGVPLDPYTVFRHVTSRKATPKDFNAFEYLRDTCDYLESPILDANAEYHARQLREMTKRRLAIEMAESTQNALRDGTDTSAASAIAEEYAARIASLQDGEVPAAGEVVDRMTSRLESHEVPIPWHLETMRNATQGGMRRGLYNLIGGLSGVGKTMFACGLTHHLARMGVPSLFFSLEMDAEDVMQRIYALELDTSPDMIVPSSETGLCLNTIAVGTPNYEWARAEVGTWPLWIWGESRPLTIDGIHDLCRTFVLKHGVQFVLIDYAGLVESGGRGVERAEDVAKGVQRLYRSLNVAGVVMTQVTRQMGGDLISRYSRDLENHAQSAYYLQRDNKLNSHPTGPGVDPILCENRKNRYGRATGHRLAIGWDTSGARFVDLQASDRDWRGE